jgi:hypothetical protein
LEWAERESQPKFGSQRVLNQGIDQLAASPQIELERTTHHALTTTVRMESASMSLSCSNPDHRGHAMSKAWNCSTASLVLASWWLRSHTRMLRARRRVMPEKLSSRTACSFTLAARDIRVKRRVIRKLSPSAQPPGGPRLRLAIVGSPRRPNLCPPSPAPVGRQKKAHRFVKGG